MFVERVNRLVQRIVAIMADEDAARGELFVAIAAEGASAAITHRNRAARIVFAVAWIGFERGRERAMPVEGGRFIEIIKASATAGNFAEEKPFVRPIMDVVALGPAAAGAGEFKRGRGARFVVVIERCKNFWRAWIFVPGGESGDADAPVFVGIPGVVEDVCF